MRPAFRTAACLVAVAGLGCEVPVETGSIHEQEIQPANPISGCLYQKFQAESYGPDGSVQTSPFPTHRFLSANGSLQVTGVSAPGGFTYSVRIRAMGEPSGGVWPHIIVKGDGAPIGNRDIVTNDWRYYNFRFPRSTGDVATIEVQLDNNVGVRIDTIELLCDGVTISAGSRSILFPSDWQPGNKSFTFNTTRWLQDYSWAGYRYGATPPYGQNAGRTIINVAAPGGASVDRDAINNAIDQANGTPNPNGAVIQLAAGTYTIAGAPAMSESLLNKITHPGVVLRGAVVGGTTNLYFTDVSTRVGTPAILFQGPYDLETGYAEKSIVANTVEFDRTLTLSDVSGLAVGDEVRIGWTNSVAFRQAHHFEMPTEPGDMTWPYWSFGMDTWQEFFRRKIESIDTVNSRVVLDVPLRFPVKLLADDMTALSPKLRKAGNLPSQPGQPGAYLTECGVESLSISTVLSMGNAWRPEVARDAAIRFQKTENSWIWNVASYSGDGNGFHLRSNGISIENSRLVTVESVTMQAAQNRDEYGNGYLFSAELGTHDTLFKNCIGDSGRHNFIVNNVGDSTKGFGSSGNVFRGPQSSNAKTCKCNTAGGCMTPCCDSTCQVSQGWTVGCCGPSQSEFHGALSTGNLIDSAIVNDGWMTWNRTKFSGNQGNTSTQSTFWNSVGSTPAGFIGLLSWQDQFGYVVGATSSLLVRLTDDPMEAGASPMTTYASFHFPSTSPRDMSGNRVFDHSEFVHTNAILSPPSLYDEQLSRREFERGVTVPQVLNFDPGNQFAPSPWVQIVTDAAYSNYSGEISVAGRGPGFFLYTPQLTCYDRSCHRRMIGGFDTFRNVGQTIGWRVSRPITRFAVAETGSIAGAHLLAWKEDTGEMAWTQEVVANDTVTGFLGPNGAGYVTTPGTIASFPAVASYMWATPPPNAQTQQHYLAFSGVQRTSCGSSLCLQWNHYTGVAQTDGTWAGWIPRDWPDGALHAGSAPAAVFTGVDHVQLAVRGSDDWLYTRNIAIDANGNPVFPNGWEGHFAGCASDPAITSKGPNKADVCVRLADNTIKCQAFDNGTWLTPRSCGGSTLQAPAVTTDGTNTYVFVRWSTDGTLQGRKCN